MNPLEESNRRVQVSADASKYAYDYEDAYTDAIKDGKSEREAQEVGMKKVKWDLGHEHYSDVTITNARYDEATGVAGIAVKDSQTGETYIAYAGTNIDADGSKDIISDAKIGLNDALTFITFGLQI